MAVSGEILVAIDIGICFLYNLNLKPTFIQARSTESQSMSKQCNDRTRGCNVELLYVDNCPNVDQVRLDLASVIDELGCGCEILELCGDYPSPTILINGQDVIGQDQTGSNPSEGACRLDLPTRDQIRSALISSK